MEIGRNEAIKQAVTMGLGIALIWAQTVAAEVADRRLSVFAVSGLPIMRQWFLVKLESKWLPPAGQSLWDFLPPRAARYLPQTT